MKFHSRTLKLFAFALVFGLFCFGAGALCAEDIRIELDNIQLAKKIHELRPARLQVDSAIEQAAQKLTPQDRTAFIVATRNALNYRVIEEQSVLAMADVFSKEELQIMLDYYSRPEAESINEKLDLYAGRLQPLIVRSLDKAMMRAKTGAP